MSRVLGLALLGLSFACAPGAASLEDETSGDADVGEGETEAPVCGNGIVEGDEACDDANDEARDGCESTCEASGRRLWTVELPAGGGWNEQASNDEELVVSGFDSFLGGHIYTRISADGVIGDLRSYPRLPREGGRSSTALAPDGSLVYFRRLTSTLTGEEAYSVRVASPDGELRWAAEVDVAHPGQLSVVGDQIIATASQNRDEESGLDDWWIRSFDLESGAQLYQWTRPSEGFFPLELGVRGNGQFMIGGVADDCSGLLGSYQPGSPQALWTDGLDFTGGFALFDDGRFVNVGHEHYAGGWHGRLDFYEPDGVLRGSVSTDIELGSDERVTGVASDAAGDLIVLHARAAWSAEIAETWYRLSKYDADGRLRWESSFDEGLPIEQITLDVARNGQIRVVSRVMDGTYEGQMRVHAHAP